MKLILTHTVLITPFKVFRKIQRQTSSFLLVLLLLSIYFECCTDAPWICVAVCVVYNILRSIVCKLLVFVYLSQAIHKDVVYIK